MFAEILLGIKYKLMDYWRNRFLLYNQPTGYIEGVFTISDLIPIYKTLYKYGNPTAKKIRLWTLTKNNNFVETVVFRVIPNITYWEKWKLPEIKVVFWIEDNKLMHSCHDPENTEGGKLE